MASRSQRQRIQQTEDPSHQRQAGSRTQATRQGQHPITAPLQQLQELANHSPRLAQLRQLQELANRSPQVAQLRRLQELAISSPQTTQLRSLQELANNGPQVAQLRQLQMLAEKAEPSAAAVISTTKPQAAASQPNLTGLPDRLKSNLEALSGLSMDAVRVHYNSSKPAQLHALAYAQGTDIHIGPGQERHLPHEAWHVVQQAQGRVRPTLQMAAGVAVNDDAGLEREADVMGGRAVEGPTGNTRYGSTILANLPAHTQGCACTSCSSPGGETAVQRQLNMKLIQRCTHCGDPTCLKGEKCRKPPTGLFVNTAGNWGTKFYNEKKGHDGKPMEWEHAVPGKAYRDAGLGKSYRSAPVLQIPTTMHRSGVQGVGGGISSTGKSHSASIWSSGMGADLAADNFGKALQRGVVDGMIAALATGQSLDEAAHGYWRIIRMHFERGDINQQTLIQLHTILLNALLNMKERPDLYGGPKGPGPGPKGPDPGGSGSGVPIKA